MQSRARQVRMSLLPDARRIAQASTGTTGDAIASERSTARAELGQKWN